MAQTATADVENSAPPPAVDPAAAAAEGPCSIPKRRQLFLLFGLVSITWCSFLLYMMHDIHLSDRQSYMDNLDFKGADIDSVFGVETASECYRRCEEHDSCLAYTYVKSEQVCWLKGEGYSTKSNPNTISGAINSTLAAMRRSVVGTKLKERDSSFEGDASLDDDWDEEGERARYRDQPWDGDDEGVYALERVRVSARDVQEYEDSTDLLGDVRVFTDVRATRDCASRCTMEPACVAWTLDKMRFLCLLRLAGMPSVRYSSDFIGARLTAEQISARAAQLDTERGEDVEVATDAADDEGDGFEVVQQQRRRAQSPYVGSPWPLPWEQAGAQSTMMDNVDLRGGDVRELAGVETAAECREACATAAADVACAGWTLSKRSSLCWLKNASYARIEQNRSAGLISGIVNEAERRPANASVAAPR